mmetsp:Transcript_59286/g.123864  ORF Transcript_59286/g.123864 Transcript_59286/m.123864 type:complete len:104 (+) Transcript_59286:142-453(+)
MGYESSHPHPSQPPQPPHAATLGCVLFVELVLFVGSGLLVVPVVLVVLAVEFPREHSQPQLRQPQRQLHLRLQTGAGVVTFSLAVTFGGQLEQLEQLQAGGNG